jgi:hypothetical protein
MMVMTVEPGSQASSNGVKLFSKLIGIRYYSGDIIPIKSGDDVKTSINTARSIGTLECKLIFTPQLEKV